MSAVNARETFPSTENASGLGVPLSSAVDATTAAAALNGAVGFAFKDSNGNTVLPQLTAGGKIKVDTESIDGVPLTAQGTVPGNAALTTVASITGAITTNYVDFSGIVSCRRDAFWQLSISNNGTPTVLASGYLGPGQYNYSLKDIINSVTSGGTGPILIVLQMQCLSTLSDMWATINCTAQSAA